LKLYQEVTDRIVAELEQGAAPWLCPWRKSKANGGSILPHNPITGSRYRGINIPILWAKQSDKGYGSNRWATYKQVQGRGAQVRKGEKATEIVFTKKLKVKDRETDEERQISMLRSYYVFNLEQIDGLTIDDVPELPDEHTRLHQAECFITATGAKIRHGGNEAAFIPGLDLIEMPPFGAFKTTEGYFCTNLHELGHWSGHTTRLDRNLAGRFGTRAYAAEELIAELTSAFLCAHLGVTGELRHAGYLKTWVELLRHDNKAIFTAAAKAQQAADYLRAISTPIDEEE
jgi:antirestriction protein ArdC